MKSRKFRWWLLLIPIILMIVILIGAFWDAILIRIAPKTVLTSALTRVFSQLEERFRDDPLLILARAVDPDGCYTADILLETSNDILGPITYDMVVQTDGASHQVYAEGTANTSGRALDLSLYLDADFMAVSSDDLVKGNFYGITYDSFKEDVYSIPLLKFAVNDTLLSQWNDSVQNVKKKMNGSYTLPELPELSTQEIQKLLLGVLALPCEVEERSISVDNTLLACHALSYSASGAQIDQWLAGTRYAEGAAITVTFYLYKDSLVNLLITWGAENSSESYSLLLGLNPMEDTLKLQHIQNIHGEHADSVVTVATAREEEQYKEVWTVQKGTEDAFSIAFSWEPSSGTMELAANSASDLIYLTLIEKENGFQFATEDLTEFIQIMTQNMAEDSQSPEVSCSMTVNRGSNIVTPAYKNLDEWTLDDLFILMESVGSLIGLNLGL